MIKLPRGNGCPTTFVRAHEHTSPCRHNTCTLHRDRPTLLLALHTKVHVAYNRVACPLTVKRPLHVGALRSSVPVH